MIKRLLDRIVKSIYHRIKVINEITLGKNGYISAKSIVKKSIITGDVRINEGALVRHNVVLQGNITIGRYTVINGPNTHIFSKVNPITIGSFCSIASNVSIQEYNHDFKKISSYFILKHMFGETMDKQIYSNGPIDIMNDVWIGTHSIILSGTKIGHGAVVAANSVVTGDVPPYAIVAGSPAKILKYRFGEDVVEELLKLKWWDWNIDRITRNKRLFEEDIDMNVLKKIVP